MSNFNIGDVVRIGKGKVEYVVSKIVNEPNDLGTYAVEVESMNTGKAQTVEAGRLTLLRSADTDPMNVPQEHASVEAIEAALSAGEASQDVEDFDPREDRRQSDYGLSILAALLRKNPNAGSVGHNPLKPIGSKRSKVRARVKRQRRAANNMARAYNEMRRSTGYFPNVSAA